MQKTLEGVKILDMTMAVSGPACTRLLADFGAEDILVEPIGGSSIRTFGPNSMGFKTYGKKSLCMNLKTDEGKEAFHKLIEWADVFVSNYRQAGLDRLGFSYEELSKINPKLIYATLTGFGEEGPNAKDMGFDVICYFGRSGLLLDTAQKGSVIQAPYGGGDINSGENLALGICAALYHRAVTGKGMKVSTSLMQSGIFINYNQIIESQYGMELPTSRTETVRPLLNTFQCKDGEWICMNAQHHWETSWPTICNLIGRPDLIEKYPDKESTMYEAAHELMQILDEGFAKVTSEEAIRVLKGCGTISISKVQHTQDVLKDPQALENEMLFPFKDADGREVLMPSTPIRFGDNKAAKYGQGEELGASTKDILKMVGYDDNTIQDWCDRGIVYAKED